jgi:hypothetical protein
LRRVSFLPLSPQNSTKFPLKTLPSLGPMRQTGKVAKYKDSGLPQPL